MQCFYLAFLISFSFYFVSEINSSFTNRRSNNFNKKYEIKKNNHVKVQFIDFIYVNDSSEIFKLHKKSDKISIKTKNREAFNMLKRYFNILQGKTCPSLYYKFYVAFYIYLHKGKVSNYHLIKETPNLLFSNVENKKYMNEIFNLLQNENFKEPLSNFISYLRKKHTGKNSYFLQNANLVVNKLKISKNQIKFLNDNLIGRFLQKFINKYKGTKLQRFIKEKCDKKNDLYFYRISVYAIKDVEYNVLQKVDHALDYFQAYTKLNEKDKILVLLNCILKDYDKQIVDDFIEKILCNFDKTTNEIAVDDNHINSTSDLSSENNINSNIFQKYYDMSNRLLNESCESVENGKNSYESIDSFEFLNNSKKNSNERFSRRSSSDNEFFYDDVFTLYSDVEDSDNIKTETENHAYLPVNPEDVFGFLDISTESDENDFNDNQVNNKNILSIDKEIYNIEADNGQNKSFILDNSIKNVSMWIEQLLETADDSIKDKYMEFQDKIKKFKDMNITKRCLEKFVDEYKMIDGKINNPNIEKMTVKEKFIYEFLYECFNYYKI